MSEKEDGDAKPTIESILDDMISRLRIIAVDVDKLQRAKKHLASIQRHTTFTQLLGHDEEDSEYRHDSDIRLLRSKISLNPNLVGDDEEDMGMEEMSEDLCQVDFEEDRWHNYFSGFQILTTPLATDPNENRKCVELSTTKTCEQDLKTYLCK